VLFGSQTTNEDWIPALLRATRDRPLVLQRRVHPDRVAIPYLDQDSGQQLTRHVPFVLSPFIIDGAPQPASGYATRPPAPRTRTW
jgi:hypothetical protein